MAVLKDLKTASYWSRLALLLLSLAAVLAGVAFSCTGWGENGLGEHWGLWRKCSNLNFDTSNCVALDGWANGWWAFTQAAAIFGFFGILTSFGLTMSYIFTDRYRKNTKVALLSSVISGITGSLYLIGCIIFGVYWARYFTSTIVRGQQVLYWLSYAYSLSIVASLLELTSGVLLVVDVRRKNETTPENKVELQTDND